MALYGVIADIHGNREALSAALALLGNLGAQRIVCLGDFVGYSADPDECVEHAATEAKAAVFGYRIPPLTNSLYSLRRRIADRFRA
jgi:predicted phosphodiesterase